MKTAHASFLQLAAASVVSLAAAACPAPPAGPTIDDALLSLHLTPGSTSTYVVNDALLETHTVARSNTLVADTTVVELTARQNGFVVDERTLAFAVGAEAVSIARLFDCVSQCAVPDAPLAFLKLPLAEGDRAESTRTVTTTVGADPATTAEETHLLVVGAARDETVPAGTFTGFPVSWSRTRDGDTDSALLFIAPGNGMDPGAGILTWESFSGDVLKLDSTD